MKRNRMNASPPDVTTYRYHVTLIGAQGQIVRGPTLETDRDIVGVTASGEEG